MNIKFTFSIFLLVVCTSSFLFVTFVMDSECEKLGFDGTGGQYHCYNNVIQDDGTYKTVWSKGKILNKIQGLLIVLSGFLSAASLAYVFYCEGEK